MLFSISISSFGNPDEKGNRPGLQMPPECSHLWGDQSWGRDPGCTLCQGDHPISHQVEFQLPDGGEHHDPEGHPPKPQGEEWEHWCQVKAVLLPNIL